jgi:hypothetical protein
MGDTFSRVAETGFAEFAALLITETLEAVIAAQISQEEKLRELVTAATLPADSYIERYLPQEVIRNELLLLFPSVKEGASGVDPGSPYSPPEGVTPESPPVKEKCGMIVGDSDIKKSETGYIFTEAGAEKISLLIARALADRQQAALKSLAGRGFPRVLVDHGRISARLTFRLTEKDTTSTGVKNAASIAGIALPATTRLRVQPINTKGPEILGLKTDITSEVEITFKTILE